MSLCGYGRMLLLTAAVVVGAVCASNGQTKPPTLVGQWIFADGYNDSKIPDKIELFSGGNGVMDDKSLTWKVENKRLMLLTSSVGIAADYKVSGYELVLTHDNEKSTIFVRKGMLEEYKKKKVERTKMEAERAKKDAEQRFGKTSTYFTDSRNGQKYRAVKIGGRSWMAENLNYQTDNSWCYGNDESYCKQYGRLYDWNTAMKACPAGWYLPSAQEWDGLALTVGGVRSRYEKFGRDGFVFFAWDGAVTKLKTKYGWNENGNGIDAFGFSALPGGERFFGGSFGSVGEKGGWWMAMEDTRDKAYYRRMNYDEGYMMMNLIDGKNRGYSVRCIQIEKTSTYFTDSRNGQKYRAVKIGGKTWMAENLNYQTSSGSWCYNDADSNCVKYGRMYDWNTARAVCPSGWHLPSDLDWSSLAKTVGGISKFDYDFQGPAGTKLKSKSGWKVSGTDDYDFSALPGGLSNEENKYWSIGEEGGWWSAEACDNGVCAKGKLLVSERSMDVGVECLNGYYWPKSYGLSVRCVEGPDDVRTKFETPMGDEKPKVSSSVTMNDGGEASKSVSSGGSGIEGGSNDGGVLEPKKNALNVSSPDFLKGGALIGGRSRASIQRIVMPNMAALRYAYNKRLREKPGMTGKITVKFAIDEFGRVIFAQLVESTMNDTELETTVVSRVKSWNFERIDKPGDVTEVTYPFVFSQ